MVRQFRQGDVLLEMIAQPLGEVTPQARENGAFVLAHGEVTGHAHALYEGDCQLYADAQGNLFLEVRGVDCVLRHEEHDPIALPVAFYRVVRQREYVPTSVDKLRLQKARAPYVERVRHVAD